MPKIFNENGLVDKTVVSINCPTPVVYLYSTQLEFPISQFFKKKECIKFFISINLIYGAIRFLMPLTVFKKKFLMPYISRKNFQPKLLY